MKLYVDGEEFDFEAEGNVVEFGDRLIVHSPGGTYSALAVRQGDSTLISFRGRQYTVSRTRARTAVGTSAQSGEIRAPMPGQIVDVRVSAGDEVVKGQVLLVLEAMKTQQPFAAPFDGTVESLAAEVGQTVPEGALLAKVAASNG